LLEVRIDIQQNWRSWFLPERRYS